jgi:hypothetical protein
LCHNHPQFNETDAYQRLLQLTSTGIEGYSIEHEKEIFGDEIITVSEQFNKGGLPLFRVAKDYDFFSLGGGSEFKIERYDAYADDGEWNEWPCWHGCKLSFDPSEPVCTETTALEVEGRHKGRKWRVPEADAIEAMVAVFSKSGIAYTTELDDDYICVTDSLDDIKSDRWQEVKSWPEPGSPQSIACTYNLKMSNDPLKIEWGQDNYTCDDFSVITAAGGMLFAQCDGKELMCDQIWRN